jgi:hypothetical protein
MEFLFIKKIIDTQIFNKTADIDVKDIFNYYPTKEKLITFCNSNQNDGNDYEFVIDVDSNPLSEKEEEERNTYMNSLKEEVLKVTKVIEYLIANLEVSKTKIANFKVYDYDNVSKHIKSKIKSGNHNLDVKKFILKNKIDKEAIIGKIKEMGIDVSGVSELKLMTYFILIKIIEIYNIYNKCLVYSINLLEEYPFTIRNKEEYLVMIDNKFMNITNDEINIYHHNLIKNAYNSNNKLGDTINLKKDKNKNFEILFK